MEDKDKKIADEFENKVSQNLTIFLQNKGALDNHVPECPDVEEKWALIGRSYLPDGAREFEQYPVVTLGWIMFVGMAMAYYWDTDWTRYSSRSDYYEVLRDKDGYDNLDETVVKSLLGYDGEAAEKIIELVAECASRVNSMLIHEHVENGTKAAFGCFVAALHQLYLAGMRMELNALGYHMTPLNG